MGLSKHHVLEDMRALEREWGSRLPLMIDRQLWAVAAGAIEQAAEFNLEIGPGDQHAQFGVEMLNRDMFRLPFPFTYFAVFGQDISVLASEYLDGLKYSISFIAYAPTAYDGHSYRLPVFMGGGSRGESGFTDFRWGHVFQPQYRRSGFDASDDHAEGAMCFVYACTALLMSKDAITEVLAAPEKLNRGRIQKGRVPISERRVIRIRPEAREAARQAAEAFRTSPAMHWRRGHFRRIRDDFVVPVAPTIVGAREDVKPAIKGYVFKGASDEIGS